MSITPMMIYWLTRLDGIKSFLDGGGFCVALIGFILAGIATPCVFCEGMPKKLLWSWLIPILGAILMVANIFIPTQKEAAAIFLIPKIANNERLQAIPNKLMDLADQWLDELRPKKVTP